MSDITRRFAQWPLGRHVIWATFDKSAAGGDPFAGCASDAEQVRQALGLVAADPDDRKLVLAVYELPDDVPARYPTIADAYASDPWNPHFQCSNPGDPWGFTSGGRPEVVHREVTGQHLTAPPHAPAVSPLRLVS